MPWTPEQSDQKKKGLSSDQKSKWSSIANSVLARTGDEAQAIRTANSKTRPSTEAIARRLQQKKGV